MPQQLADLTLAEVEIFFCRDGIRFSPYLWCHWSSPLSNKADRNGSTCAHCIYLHLSARQPVIDISLSTGRRHEWTNAPSVHYHQHRETAGREFEGFLLTRPRKANPLPRQHSPVNWYAAPLSIDAFLFRFPWSQETLRKSIRDSTRASTRVDPLYLFKCITFSNLYWKEPVGWLLARPVGRAPDCLNYQLQHLDLTSVPA